MSKLIALSLNDFRSIFRERILYILFVGAPVIMFIAAKYAVPRVGEQYPVIQPYYTLILMLQIFQVVGGIGFVIASIILDERDEDVLTMLKVTPISSNFFIAYRILFSVLISFVYGLAMILFTGLADMPILQAIISALLLAAVTPIMALALSSFSNNKVEGLAVYKGLNLILLIPAASFFLPVSSQPFFWIIPVYWSFQWFVVSGGGHADWLVLGIALLSNFALILGLVWVFRRRVF